MQLFTLEHDSCDKCEYGERNHFLDHLELHKREGTAITYETNLVGWYLKGVLEEGDGPREEDDKDERPRVGDVHLLKLEVAVPSEGHEDVASDKEKHCV